MASITQIQTVIGNNFLEPIGLLALTALIPLIIFYLIKKKPDREIMPSMMFFMEDKKSGKAHKAFKKLQRNNLLLLHILLIGLLAAAIAQPFVESHQSSEEAVIVFDRSASMANQIDDAKDFASEHSGSDNTLVVLDSSSEIVLQDASPRQLESYLNDIEETHLPGDIANGIEYASRQDGDLVIASDLQHSNEQRNPEEVINDLRNDGRAVTLFEPDSDNSWGITDIDPAEDESSVNVKNFMDLETDITIQKDGQEVTRSVEGGAVETVTVSTSPGKNTVSLDRDGFTPDNNAYISVPEQENHEVVIISEEENPYLETALELIEFVDAETVNPPVETDLDADVYILGPTDNILSETVNAIEDDVNSGASLVVFSHKNVFDQGFSSLPVEESFETRETVVELAEPQATSFETEILSTNITGGDSYTEPEEAMVIDSYGEGNVFFYNIADRDFNQDLVYPLLWQHALKEMLDQPSVEELNLRTGDEINYSSIETPSGEVEEGLTELDQVGFYETESRVYAANLMNEDESYSETPDIDTGVGGEETTEREMQTLLIMIIALLLVLELIYLRYIGEI